MKRGKNLTGLVIAVVLCLSLILVPVVSRLSPTRAAGTWEEYSANSVLSDGVMSGAACVIYDSDEGIYKMWYTRATADLDKFDGLVDNVLGLELGNLINDIKALDFSAIANNDAANLKNIIDYLASLNVANLETLLVGTGSVISYATSPNGISWTPGTANPVLEGTPGAWDKYYVSAPCVIRNSTTDYEMWYTGGTIDLSAVEALLDDLSLLSADNISTILGDIVDIDIAAFITDVRAARGDDYLLDIIVDLIDVMEGTGVSIGHATSTDGENWTKDGANPVLSKGGVGAWDRYGVGAPCVIRSGTNEYEMWYTGCEVDYGNLLGLLTAGNINEIEAALLAGINVAIGHATSTNGTAWDKDAVNNPVLEKGTADAWDKYGVGTPWVIRHSSTNYEMWYTGAKMVPDTLMDFLRGINNLETTLVNGTNSAIGHATFNGIAWTSDANPVLSKGSGDTWDKYGVGAPCVVKMGNTYKMWYTGAKSYLSTFIRDILDGSDLDPALSNTNIAIGYASYQEYIPSSPPPPPEEEEEIIPEEEEEEEVIPEEEEEEVIPEEEEEEEEIIPEEEVVTPEVIEELSAEEAADILEELSTEDAANIIEEIATDTAADILEELSTEDAASIIEEVATDAAADILEELSTEDAADIIEEVATDTAVDIIEEVATDAAADIIEEVVIDAAAAILEEVATDTAVDIMEEVATNTLNGLVGEMNEESLMDTLPEVSTDTLHSIDVETLFDALPNAPTEQLTSENPPEPPEELTDPVVRYTTPSGAQYVAVRTITGEWVVVVATPEPLDKLLIKTNKALKDVETTVEIFDELPSEVKVELPVGQIIIKYFNIGFENAKPENIELGHLGFHVEDEWLEQNSIHKWSVTLNQYDPELEQWLSLPTKKVGEDDVYVYYTAVVTHFSTFAISGSQVLSPLEFEASNLVIGSGEIPQAGEDITISADITNLSNTAGTYAVTLWIDDTVEAGKNVSLEAGETTPVSFTVTRDVEGSYQVRLDRLLGSFRVIGVAQAPIAWWVWLIVGLGVVGIGGLLAYFLWWKRRIA